MKCFYCRGLMEHTTVTDFVDFGTCIIAVRDVPCHKCVECGEVAFDLRVGERVEQIVDTLKDSLTGEVAVVKYSLTDIDAVKYSETIAA